MVIRVLGILCVGVAHQSNKSTQLEITNAEALVTLVRLLRSSKKPLIQVCFAVCSLVIGQLPELLRLTHTDFQ